jgi:hypothetical protein
MSDAPLPIADDELLYRRVRREDYRWQPDGTPLALSVAFADRRYRPSVNRAALCNYDPSVLVAAPTDGVVGIHAAEVRATDEIVQNDAHGRPLRAYLADVEPVPLPDNLAHAEIVLHPDCDTVSVFRKLCTRLARLANARPWELYPPPLTD